MEPAGLEGRSRGVVTVRYNRRRGLLFGGSFLVLAGPAFAQAAWTGDLAVALLWAPFFVFFGLWTVVRALRAEPQFLIDSTGLTFCRAEAHLDWAEVAAVEVQAWRSGFTPMHRLTLRAVHPDRFDPSWDAVPRRPWIARPRDGRIQWHLDLLSPSPARIAEAIGESSDGRFAPAVQHVARRPLRYPEPV